MVSWSATVCVALGPSLRLSVPRRAESGEPGRGAPRPCAPRCLPPAPYEGSSFSDSELPPQSLASESLAAAPSPARSAAIFERIFSALSTLPLRVAMRSLRSYTSSFSSLARSCSTSCSAPSAAAPSSTSSSRALYAAHGAPSACSVSSPAQSSWYCRVPRARLLSTRRRVTPAGLPSRHGPKSSGGAFRWKETTLRTSALTTTSCWSEASCALSTVSVSRKGPASDGEKMKRIWREPNGRTQPSRSSRVICRSNEACLPDLDTL